MIPYGRQSLDEDDFAAVAEVLRGDWLTQGPNVERFEAALAEKVGARFAVAFNSGTSALQAAAWAAGLGPGDTVATSALTFIASANCARYVGASVRLVDIDPATLNLDPALVPDCDALVAVHFAGLPVDLERLAHRPRVLIEDAAHALGAATPDGPVGNCARSDMCVFSFHPVKAITTGEGGAVTTNSESLAERLRTFRNHGYFRIPEEGQWYYEARGEGGNHRLTDIQAALGVSQLTKLDGFIERRNELASRYRSLLADAALALPPAAPPGWWHAYHLFPVRVVNRRAVYEELRDRGIGVQVHYVPLYRHPVLGLEASAEDFPETEAAYSELLSLPLFPALTEGEQDQVIAAVSESTATPSRVADG